VRFVDRTDAGRALAARLGHLAGPDLVVLALPRGGSPVAAEVARGLGAPLDVVLVRKLGVPFRPELAMGAVGEGGVVVRNASIVRWAGVGEDEVAAAAREARDEIERRARRFRPDRGLTPPVAGFRAARGRAEGPVGLGPTVPGAGRFDPGRGAGDDATVGGRDRLALGPAAPAPGADRPRAPARRGRPSRHRAPRPARAGPRPGGGDAGRRGAGRARRGAAPRGLSDRPAPRSAPPAGSKDPAGRPRTGSPSRP
jgi:hypothetical protein